MSTNPSDVKRPRNPTHFGGEGLYDPGQVEDAAAADAETFKVSLGEQLDASTREALLADQPRESAQSFVRRHPIPTALAIGSIALLLVSLTRRSMR